MIIHQNTIFYNFSQMFFLFWKNSTALAMELCLNCRTNLGYPYQSVHFFGTKSLILCAESGTRTRTSIAHCPLKTACLPVPPLRLKIIPHPNQVMVAHLAEQFLFQVRQVFPLQPALLQMYWFPILDHSIS